MKKTARIGLSLICLVAVLSGCGSKIYEKLDSKNVIAQGTAENQIENGEYTLYLENDYLSFYMNPNTTELKVINKKDSSVWYSSSNSGISDAGKALVHLSYADTRGNKAELNSYENAVCDGQYEIIKEDGKVTVKYSIGSFSSQVLIPEVITEERYSELCEQFDDEFALMKFKNYYYYFDKDSIDNEETKNEYIGKYEILKSKPMYVVNSSVLTSSNIKREFAEVLSKCNYTKEMYNEDSKNFKTGSDTISEAGCNITLEFTLDGNSLSVNAPNNKIEMYADYPVTDISILKYFASPAKGENGYYLLPDGSGSLMNFYNGKTDGHNYSVTVYGTGYSLSQREKTSNYSDAALPIFGINKGNTAVFAEITSGEAVADINAYSGDDKIAPFVSPLFRMREVYTTQLSSGRQEDFTTIQKQRFSGDMAIRYSFLTGDDADYNGMAAFYRNRLFGDAKNSDGKINTVLEYIGIFDKKAQIFGVGYNKKIVASDFKSIEENIKFLTDAGLSNVNVRLSGWLPDGYSHSSLSKINVPSSLGGEKGLKSLSDKLDSMNTRLWLDADVQYTRASGLNSGSKAIKTISKAVGTTYSYDLASFTQIFGTAERRVNNVGAVLEEIGYFKNYAEKKSFSSISLRQVGKSVNADFDEDAFADNQTTADKISESINEFKNSGMSIMTSGANKYILNSAEMCLDIPLTSNKYDSTDKSVPFLQAVLRGNVSYAGQPVNLSGNSRDAVLYAAQTGADIYYLLTCNNSDELIESEYSNLYSTDSENYKQELTDEIVKYQSELSATAGQRITRFQYVYDAVTKTTFENNAVVYVNFGTEAAATDGKNIPAKSYVVVKG